MLDLVSWYAAFYFIMALGVFWRNNSNRAIRYCNAVNVYIKTVGELKGRLVNEKEEQKENVSNYWGFTPCHWNYYGVFQCFIFKNQGGI